MFPKENRALVVEDDRSWQQILTEILSDAGLIVDVADNFNSAVEKLRTYPHRLAVVDLSLGGIDHHNQDGLRVLDAIRRADPTCVSLLLTGFATVELAVEVMRQYGALTCMRKEEFRRVAFRGAVNEALVMMSHPTVTHNHEIRKLSEQQAIRDTSVSETTPLSSFGRALLVEDDSGWRSLMMELLTIAGYHVHASRSYVEAIGRLNRETYQLAVVDLALASSLHPENNLDGYHLLGKAHEANIPTIVVSGFVTPERIEQAYEEHEIFACLEKQSFDREAFLDIVEEARERAKADSIFESLTKRELEVLGWLARGRRNKEIAEILFVTPNTVKRHLRSIFAKLNVTTRAAAVAKTLSADVMADI